MPLTDTRIRSLKSGDKELKVLDSEGLYLVVHPNGSKYWQFRFTHLGKRKAMSFGKYPEVSLLDARDLRAEAKRMLADGKDPAAIKQEERRRATLAAANTFESVAREWWDKKRDGWTERHAERTLAGLERNVFPEIGARPVSSLTGLDILAVIRGIEKRGALVIAAQSLQRISAICTYAVIIGKAASNPAYGLHDALKERTTSHYRHMEEKDLHGFLCAIDDHSGRLITRLAMRLMCYTFVRTFELRNARWDQMDLEAAEWRIPPRYMKMKRLHVVPLSRQAIDVIERIRVISGRSEWLFPNARDITRPMTENTLLKLVGDIGYRDVTTVHGIRSTASTILNEKGKFRSDAIERQLAHVERNETRRAYNHADYLDERRDMMQWWADYLDDRKAGNVVKMPPVRRRSSGAGC